MNASTVITLFPNEKSKTLYVEKLKSEILNGLYNPLEASKKLNDIIKIATEILKDKDVQEACFKNFDSSKKISFNDFEVELCERSDYDYENCNDSELVLMEQELSILKEKIKNRQSFLKAIKTENVCNADTGEQLFPPAKKTITYLKFKQK